MSVVSPNGKIRATGQFDGVVRLYNTDRGGAETVLRGHQGPVTVLVFSPDGVLLASGSVDRSVRLWKIDPATGTSLGKPVVLSEHTHWVRDLVFSPDGQTLVTHSEDQTVRRWKINPERLAEEVCKVARRPLTQEEWQNYVGADIPYSEYEPCSR